jgi:hypothetical protein
MARRPCHTREQAADAKGLAKRGNLTTAAECAMAEPAKLVDAFARCMRAGYSPVTLAIIPAFADRAGRQHHHARQRKGADAGAGLPQRSAPSMLAYDQYVL